MRALVLLSCCCKFAFCSTTHGRPLSHLSLLAFVTSECFTFRCHLYFILRCHLFFFINVSAFSYCLSLLLPNKVSRRNVVNSIVCFFTGFCSLKYYNSILFVLHKCRNFLSVAKFGAAILVFSARFVAALLLLQVCLLFNHLRSSAFSPFSTGFCHF